MATFPKKAETRIRSGIKQFYKILANAKTRDVNESDTVTIVTDILCGICGYDKYAEITSEYAIRNTYCDLAIKIDDKLIFLIEVKAIGISLKESHFRQALNYAATEGVEWVILTNGDHWQAHRVVFGKPVKTEVVFDFNFLDSGKPADLAGFFFLISKEGVKKSAIDIYHEEVQLTSRFMIAAALQLEPVLSTIRKQLRAISSKIKITDEDILNTIKGQVLKRDVLEGDEAVQAKKRLASATKAKKKSVRKASIVTKEPVYSQQEGSSGTSIKLEAPYPS